VYIQLAAAATGGKYCYVLVNYAVLKSGIYFILAEYALFG
jgi:hypothetical protein